MTYVVPLLSLLAAAFAVLTGVVVDPPACSESDVNTLAQASLIYGPINVTETGPHKVPEPFILKIYDNVTTVNATCLTCINENATK